MSADQKKKGAVKFIFWTIISFGILVYAWHSYSSGQMVAWYYYQASVDGYAINAFSFKEATKENPAVLQVGAFEQIVNLQAVPVKAGDRLPINATGIISTKDLKEGKRVKLEGDTIKVMVPTEVKEAKGFKYKDTYKHKGIKTNPWSGAWNVGIVFALGIALGYMAEGFTDLFGLKLKKIEHYGH
ncbi:MAG: hypothetical protein HPY84_00730 [Syntrophobacteraceae bacterium]|jgi:hypothetical protein|nr:hypothetical protein [Syntrophobacteraceae bacterium]